MSFLPEPVEEGFVAADFALPESAHKSRSHSMGPSLFHESDKSRIPTLYRLCSDALSHTGVSHTRSSPRVPRSRISSSQNPVSQPSDRLDLAFPRRTGDKAPHRNVFDGPSLAVVQSTQNAGLIRTTATTPGICFRAATLNSHAAA